ncbi:MAG: hypothetical protein ACTSQ4_02325 [Candidatus Heimdallarchaeaceae archaeon]
MGLFKKLMFIGIIILFILSTFGFVFMMTTYDLESRECAKNHGGIVTRGYCTYIEDGQSYSYNIWDKVKASLG